MSWRKSFCFKLVRCLPNIMGLYIQFLSQVWEIFSYYLFKLTVLPSPSLSQISITLVLTFWKESYSSCTLFIFFKYLVFLFSSTCIISRFLSSRLFFLPYALYFWCILHLIDWVLLLQNFSLVLYQSFSLLAKYSFYSLMLFLSSLKCLWVFL